MSNRKALSVSELAKMLISKFPKMNRVDRRVLAKNARAMEPKATLQNNTEKVEIQ